MRKWKLLALLATLLVGVAACQKSEKASWLTGTWKIAQWNTTYEWTYNNGALQVQQPADKKGTWKLKEQKGDSYLFEGTDGTQYHLTKIDETHLKFYQSAKKGRLGLTQEVEASKEN
ncbi:hypothetical protein ACSFB8_11900 [Enterococcus faecalis]